MIEVITGGLQTTIQDLGRRGAMHLGIGHSGVMDTLSAISANRLVGMDDNNPVLECTLVGPSLKFHDDMLIAICGSDMTFTLQQQAIQQNRPIAVSKGTTLTFKSNHLGARAYIAFSKTMDIQPVLGSVATHLGARIGGLNGRALMRLRLTLRGSRQPDMPDTTKFATQAVQSLIISAQLSWKISSNKNIRSRKNSIAWGSA